MDDETEYLYRYMEYYYETGIDINLQRYKIIKRTPKGAWIKYYNEIGKKFVLLSARKQFACETVELALESFKYRKIKQFKIYESKVKNLKHILFSFGIGDKKGILFDQKYNVKIDKESKFDKNIGGWPF